MDRKKHIDICFSPLLFQQYHQEDNLVVVIDLFRATTAITTALANGAHSVKPIADIASAMNCRDKGFLIAGERNGIQLQNFDFGNSPLEFTPEKVKDQSIAMTTTNGTQAFAAAYGQPAIAASLLNYKAVMQFIEKSKRDILFLCSGWTMKMNIEDTLLAGLFAMELLQKQTYYSTSDSIAIAKAMLDKAGDEWLNYILKSSPRLNSKFEKLKEDIYWALKIDYTDIVPILNDDLLVSNKNE